MRASPKRWAWLHLVLAIVFVNGGNFWLDSVSKDIGVSLRLVLSWRFAAGVSCLGLGFVFYVRALSRLPLSVVYPALVGVTVTAISVAGYLQAHSPPSAPQLLGVLSIFFGVGFLSLASDRR